VRVVCCKLEIVFLITNNNYRMKKADIQKMESQSRQSFTYATHDIQDYRQSWRIFRIMAEFVEGYSFLSTLKNEITIFGSARFSQDDPYYIIARELGKMLGEKGHTIITGGGPGIMEAANRGAHDAGAESVGLNIQLPFEQILNAHTTKSASFNYFFTRKVMLTSPATAFVCFPGGFGTMDEFFEVVDLCELGMMQSVPIVLVGSSYWNPLLEFLRKSCCATGSITEEQIDKIHVVDTAEEAYILLQDVEDRPHDPNMVLHQFSQDGNIEWKVFRIMAELVEGFEFLVNMKEDITVLGTKHIPKDSHYYSDAEKLGKQLVDHGFSVVTGGKYGIAEAVNKGAYEAGGASYGLGMDVGGHRELNPYLTQSMLFRFAFTRKLIVTAPSKGFVFFPGGFGTLHQLFEVLTLIQTKKMAKRPIILYDREFWQPLHEFIKTTMVHDVGTVSDEDDELYQIVDSVEAIHKILGEAPEESKQFTMHWDDETAAHYKQ